tara:strand:+ start:2956 stop:4179 length:1224 start_codon:yes stop_codon:yes gene_type:complete
MTQIKVEQGNYSFDKVAKTITFIDASITDVLQIKPIINGSVSGKTDTVIFNPADKDVAKFGALVGNVLTLEFDTDTADYSNADKLYICVNGVVYNNIRGGTYTETDYLENNTIALVSPKNPYKVTTTIHNEGFRNLYYGYTNPFVLGTSNVLAAGESVTETYFNGDIYLIWEFNPSGDASNNFVFITAVAAIDLATLFLFLKALVVTNVTFPVLTNNTTVEPGVYSQAAAKTPTGTITLDGLNQTNPIFVFLVTGALTISANAEFILTNGATAKNIFWVSDGAVSLGANSVCFGTFISLVANSTGNNSVLTGRALSLGGAVANSGDVSVPATGSEYELGYLENFALFTSAGAITNTGSNTIAGDVGTNLGAITGFGSTSITGSYYTSVSTANIPSVGGKSRVVEITK